MHNEEAATRRVVGAANQRLDGGTNWAELLVNESKKEAASVTGSREATEEFTAGRGTKIQIFLSAKCLK